MLGEVRFEGLSVGTDDEVDEAARQVERDVEGGRTETHGGEWGELIPRASEPNERRLEKLLQAVLRGVASATAAAPAVAQYAGNVMVPFSNDFTLTSMA